MITSTYEGYVFINSKQTKTIKVQKLENNK